MGIRNAQTCEGAEEAKTKVLEFLQKVEKGLETEGEMKVFLVQAATGGEMPVAEDIYDFTTELSEFVSELIEEAEKDAIEIGKSRVKYAVRVEGQKARCSFSLKVQQDENDDLDDFDELPNRKGIIAQQMQHTEVFAKLIVDQSRAGSDLLQQEIKRLQRENEQLRKREMDSIKLIEDLRSMQFARDLEVMKVHKGEKRKEQVANMLLQGAPILLTKLLGGGAGAMAGAMAQAATGAMGTGGGGEGDLTPSQLEMMLQGFIVSFTQAQLQQVMTSGIFNQMQVATFMEILQYVISRSDARESAAKASGSGNHVNGHANATHGAAPHDHAPTP